jgi:hypothetical protein
MQNAGVSRLTICVPFRMLGAPADISAQVNNVLEVYALHLSRDLAYIVGVAPINSTLCNTFHHNAVPI